MRRVLWWLRPNTDGLEQAKRADAVADERLRQAKADGLWARRALDRNGFAEALVHIIQGGQA